MNILLTSGGTTTPIDDVRFIANFSSGGFGKRLATAALLAGHRVTHLHHKDAPTPFEFKVDLIRARGTDYASRLEELHSFSRKHMGRFQDFLFNSYDDYAKKLEELCTNFVYDAVILCAAVSDYRVKRVISGKISSANGATIELEPTEKLISQVKVWQPSTKLVGFKLLSNTTDKELFVAAEKSLFGNNCYFVVANDLAKIDIGMGQREVHIISRQEIGWAVVAKNDIYHDTPSEIAKIIIDRLE